MRPLRLTLEGFTCFKERQDPLDFQGLELFAIAGPTGAGKSSLLDAMIFALFGKVPRLRQGLSELIALGSVRAAVSLDFQLGDREFRVYRALHRSRSTSAQLEERVDGMRRSLSEGVRETDRHIQELLGLDYDTFIRAVILPQGDFAAFLKSSASKQREILRKLLRLDTYEDMRALARRRARDLETRSEEGERRLREDYGEATAEHVASTRRQLADMEVALGADEVALKRCRERLERQRGQRLLWEEWEDKSARHRALVEQEEASTRRKARLAAARRVAPLLPLLDELGDDEGRRRLAAARVDEAAAAHGEARSKHGAAVDALAKAKDEAEDLGQWQRQAELFRRLEDWVEPRRKALQQSETLAGQHVAKWAKLQAVERQRDEAASRFAALEQECREADERLHDLAYDADLDRRLDAAREPAERLRHRRREGEELRQQADEARHTLRDAEAAEEQARRQAEGAKQDLAASEAAHDGAREALRLAEHSHRVNLLRGDLAAGDPCPVCGQTVNEESVVSPEVHQRLEAQHREAETLRQAEEGARARVAEAERRLANREATVRGRRDAWNDVSKRASVAATEVGELAAELHVILEGALPGDVALAVEDTVGKAVDAMAETRRRYREGTEALRRQQHRLAEVERQRDRLLAEAKTLHEQLSDLDARLDDLRRELETLQGRFDAAGLEGDDVSRRRAEAERRIASLRRQLDEATEAERRDAVELATAKQRHEEARAAASALEEQQRQRRERLHQRLAEAGFESPEVARGAALDDASMQALGDAQRRLDQEREVLEQRLGELTDGMGETAVSAADVAALEEELRNLEQAERRQRQGLATLGASFADLERRHLRRGELEGELNDLRRTHGAFQELQRELGGQRFQAFLLEKVFHDLVEGATLRLLELSQRRYELAFESSSFVVVDHDNASQRRSADTLSGGETFLASLALALELCEQVQREAGAITLESLFIDEGFGTLDPETLETVAGAIEALPHGGRMVGIITHLPELTERLPWRVMVEKGPAGSRYRIEEG